MVDASCRAFTGPRKHVWRNVRVDREHVHEVLYCRVSVRISCTRRLVVMGSALDPVRFDGPAPCKRSAV